MGPQEPHTNLQPEQPITPQGVAMPASTATVPVPTSHLDKPKKGLAIAALVLSIVSVVLGVLWFIAAPLAVTAIILAVVSLVHKRAGKGLSISGLVVGGVSLLVLVPFWFTVTIVAYNGIQEKAVEAQSQTIINE